MVCHIAYKCVKQITLQTVWYSFNEFHCSEKVSKCSNKIKIHFKYRKSHWSWVMKIFVNFCKFFIWFFNLFYLVFKKSKTFEKKQESTKNLKKHFIQMMNLQNYISLYNILKFDLCKYGLSCFFFIFAKCKQKKKSFQML